MSDKETAPPTPKQEVAQPAPKEEATSTASPVITLETFARRHATRTNAEDEEVRAVPLMAAFVYEQRQKGNLANTEANYKRAWAAFKRS